jgi:hypothetical protein
MTHAFTGSVLLPGEQGQGLHATFEMQDDVVRLTSGTDELGAWGTRDFYVEPSGKGAFRLGLGGEELFFTPSSPSSFAEAMHVPLQPETPVKDAKPKYDIDAAIDEAIANVKPLRSIKDEDDILSKPLLTTIVVLAGSLMAGLVGMSFVL